MSYHRKDALKDVKAWLRHPSETWRWSEIVYVLKDWRNSWRCWIGIHWYGLHTRYYGYYEPPDDDYYCPKCDRDGYPWRMRWMWFWNETFADWNYRWDKYRHPERYE